MQIDTSKPIIITSGQKYTDIDGFACAIALNELLHLLDINSAAVLPGVLNESIPDYLKSLNVEYEINFTGNVKDYNYILVDISEEEHFAQFVIKDNIIRLYDHRFFGFEKYWQAKLGTQCMIERVGSCATLIFEEYEKESLAAKMSKESAMLIAHAIVSNTLNLQAGVTSNRDLKALEIIEKMGFLEQDYKAKYFTQVSEYFLKDPINSLENDTKKVTIGETVYRIGQLELWDSKALIKEFEDEILNFFRPYKNEGCFFTSPSISEGRNYLLTESKEMKKLLEKLLGANFVGNVGTTDKIYLRKEIMEKIAKLSK